MVIKKIEWKNIFSYGNAVESIVFDDGGSLWQLAGKTGSGKTSIIQLPYLLLYGEAINGVNLASIPNRTNVKDNMIKGTIVVGSDTYEITRSFQPHTITILRNGENVDLPGTDAKQDYIRREVMGGIPKNIYKNIMNLSLDKDVSFIDMGAKDKRSIIDFLLDMEVLNYYTELLKKDNQNVTQSINESNGSINVIDRNLQRAKMDFETKRNVLDTQEKSDYDEQTTRGKINELNTLYKKGRVEYIEKENIAISELETKKSGFSIKKGSCSANLNALNKQLDLLKNDKCPTCGSSFKTPNFEEVRRQIEVSIEATLKELSGYESEIKKIDDAIFAKRTSINKINAEVKKIDEKIQELNNAILSAERYKTAESTFKTAESEVARLENEKKEESNKVTENERDVRLLEILKGVYSDKGVKKVLREKYVPDLNREINKSLKLLEIPYSFEFDNNFEATILDRGDRVQIESLSRGEKQRCNMAVLYSLIRIVKNKYPSLNMVALDETTSHVDDDTAMEAFKFFKMIATELNLNVFVVTHNEVENDEVFNHRLFIEKNGGFSNIVRRR